MNLSLRQTSPSHRNRYSIAGILCAVLIALFLPALISSAQSPNATETFGHEILPILSAKCTTCHGDRMHTEGGLDLSSLRGLVRGGDGGPAIAIGRSDESLLLQQVRDGSMPPKDKGQPLTESEIKLIADWIDRSKFPKVDEILAADNPLAKAHDHWAFQSRRKTIEIPAVSDAEWSETAIDRFVRAAQLNHDVEPVALADPATLLRRVTIDLTGLPPTIEEQNRFLREWKVVSEQAYRDLVERLLSSFAYGERWGRHWLDVARYADTSGCLADYPNPWMVRYRDWVIKAFNADLPYDEFLRWQIAGDILAKSANDPETYADQTIATGFIAASRRFGLKINEAQHLTIEDTIDTVGRGLMGLTMRCARCHDHKFDPIPTEDYYALYGIFASTRYPFCGSSEYKAPVNLVSVAFEPNQRRIEEDRMQLISDMTLQIRGSSELKKVKPLYESLIAKRTSTLAQGLDATAIDEEIEKLKAKHPKLEDWFEVGSGGLKKLRQTYFDEFGDPAERMVYAVAEGDPKDAAVQQRGEPKLQGRVVPRGMLSEIHPRSMPTIENGSGRMELANWLTDPDHPLVARVMVNRVWQWHFGQGIVATSDSFGVMGSIPSHPELLDWLANRFVESGWSIKQLHREIVLSRTYRLASVDQPQARAIDGNNVWLWQFRPRRLEAEALRDSIMSISGTLDREPDHAPHPFPSWWDGKAYNLNYPFDAASYPSNHRSLYLMTQRFFAHPYLGLFNGPNTNQTTSVRDRSDVSTQILYLLNSDWIDEQTTAFAKSLLKRSVDDAVRLQFTYRTMFARKANAQEVRFATEFLRDVKSAVSDKDQELKAWSAFAKALFLSNEFAYLN